MLDKLENARAWMDAAVDREYEFVADAAHEVRTPLTNVPINLELLADDLHGEHAEMRWAAMRSARRMQRVVDDLLTLSRLHTRRLQAYCGLAGTAAGATARLHMTTWSAQ